MFRYIHKTRNILQLWVWSRWQPEFFSNLFSFFSTLGLGLIRAAFWHLATLGLPGPARVGLQVFVVVDILQLWLPELVSKLAACLCPPGPNLMTCCLCPPVPTWWQDNSSANSSPRLKLSVGLATSGHNFFGGQFNHQHWLSKTAAIAFFDHFLFFFDHFWKSPLLAIKSSKVVLRPETISFKCCWLRQELFTFFHSVECHSVTTVAATVSINCVNRTDPPRWFLTVVTGPPHSS